MESFIQAYSDILGVDYAAVDRALQKILPWCSPSTMGVCHRPCRASAVGTFPFQRIILRRWAWGYAPTVLRGQATRAMEQAAGVGCPFPAASRLDTSCRDCSSSRCPLPWAQKGLGGISLVEADRVQGGPRGWLSVNPTLSLTPSLAWWKERNDRGGGMPAVFQDLNS